MIQSSLILTGSAFLVVFIVIHSVNPHLSLSTRFVLGIVLDAGAREINKIHENCALVDILDMTPMAVVTCNSDGGQERASNCRHKFDQDPEAVQEEGDCCPPGAASRPMWPGCSR